MFMKKSNVWIFEDEFLVIAVEHNGRFAYRVIMSRHLNFREMYVYPTRAEDFIDDFETPGTVQTRPYSEAWENVCFDNATHFKMDIKEFPIKMFFCFTTPNGDRYIELPVFTDEWGE